MPSLTPSRSRADCRKDKIVVVNLSGRGDKDCFEAARLMGIEI